MVKNRICVVLKKTFYSSSRRKVTGRKCIITDRSLLVKNILQFDEFNVDGKHAVRSWRERREEKFQHVKSGSGSGIGVRNVNERIRLYFGQEYGLSIESELDEGTVVTIHMRAVPYAETAEGEKIHVK